MDLLSMVLLVCGGVVATVTMDVLGSVSRKIGLVAGAKGQWIGRWYLGIARGQFIHSNIAASPEQASEKWAALVGHYAIGIALAVFYVVALGYGFATCVFPWLLVFPALGYGLFGRRGPPELRLFTSSLMNHLFYGFGLWWIMKLFRFGQDF